MRRYDLIKEIGVKVGLGCIFACRSDNKSAYENNLFSQARLLIKRLACATRTGSDFLC